MHPSGAKSSDVLVLTKPLGTGLYIAADRHNHPNLDFEVALTSMRRSNACIKQLIQELSVHAAVDVAGFGLSEALCRIAKQSHLSISVRLEALPLLPMAKSLAQLGFHTRLTDENYMSTHEDVSSEMLSYTDLAIMNDPQTSGGLLVALPAQQADKALEICRTHGLPHTRVIGTCLAESEAKVIVR